MIASAYRKALHHPDEPTPWTGRADGVRIPAGTNLPPDEWTGWADMARSNSPEGHQENVFAEAIQSKYLIVMQIIR
jgi:hypothetical protein